MCPWGKCPGGTCPGGFCPVTISVWQQTVVSYSFDNLWCQSALCIIHTPRLPPSPADAGCVLGIESGPMTKTAPGNSRLRFAGLQHSCLLNLQVAHIG